MSIKLKKEEGIEVIVVDDDSSVETSGVELAQDEPPLPQEEAHLLAIPNGTIPDTLKFHPGCSVVCMDGEDESPLISFGTVLYVSFDLSTLKYLYKIDPHPTGDPFLAEEHLLRFAQGTPVWAKISPRGSYVEALILSAGRPQQKTLSSKRFQAAPSAAGAIKAKQELTYSVVRPAHPGIFDGISAKHIKFRPDGSIQPTDDDGVGDVPQHGERTGRDGCHRSRETSIKDALKNTRSASLNRRRNNERPINNSLSQRLHNVDNRVGNREKVPNAKAQEKSRPVKRDFDMRANLLRAAGDTPRSRQDHVDEQTKSPAKRSRLESSSDPVTRILSIPKSTEYSAVVSAAAKGDLKQNAIRLNINLSSISQKGHCPVALKLTGPPCNFLEFRQLVKAQVANGADKGDRVRAMHEFDLANDDAAVKNDKSERSIVTLIEPPLFHMKAHVGIQRLPNQEDIVAQFIGKGGEKIKEMKEQTNCTITVVQQDTKLPHVRVLGNSAENVMRCVELIRDRFTYLHERKNAYSERPGEGRKRAGEHHSRPRSSGR